MDRPINLDSSNTGTITIGGTNTSGTLIYTGAIDISTNSGPSHELVVTANTGGTVQFSCIIPEGSTDEKITENNAGTVIFTVSNNYSGLTAVSESLLNIQDKSALGGTGNRMTSGTLVSRGTAIRLVEMVT